MNEVTQYNDDTKMAELFELWMTSSCPGQWRYVEMAQQLATVDDFTSYWLEDGLVVRVYGWPSAFKVNVATRKCMRLETTDNYRQLRALMTRWASDSRLLEWQFTKTMTFLKPFGPLCGLLSRYRHSSVNRWLLYPSMAQINTLLEYELQKLEFRDFTRLFGRSCLILPYGLKNG